MKINVLWTLGGVCACLGLVASSQAQQGRPLTVLVKRAGAQGPYGGMCELTLQRALQQAGLEVMSLEAPKTDDMVAADLIVRYNLRALEDGGRKRLRLSLEASTGTTAKVVGIANEESAPFGAEAGRETRAIDEVCGAGGAALLSQLQAYREALEREGEPYRIEVRNPPDLLILALHPALKKICTRTHILQANQAGVVVEASCQVDQVEMRSTLRAVIDKKFPKRKYSEQCNRGLLVLVFNP